MTQRTVLLLAFLLATGFAAGRSMSAQDSAPASVPADFMNLTQPVILAGSDVGFQVTRMDGEIPVGHVVVRINGVWVAADTTR